MTKKYISVFVLLLSLTSCDPYFWMGVMAGMTGMPAYSGYNSYTAYPTYAPSYTPTYDWSSTPIATGAGVGTSTSSSSSSSSSSSGTCRLCNGTGKQIKETYVGGSVPDKWCSTCSKKVYGGHSHVRCTLCGGSGIY